MGLETLPGPTSTSQVSRLAWWSWWAVSRRVCCVNITCNSNRQTGSQHHFNLARALMEDDHVRDHIDSLSTVYPYHLRITKSSLSRKIKKDSNLQGIRYSYSVLRTSCLRVLVVVVARARRVDQRRPERSWTRSFGDGARELDSHLPVGAAARSVVTERLTDDG